MPRAPRPWFRRQTGWWMAQINGEKIKLAQGRANRKTAEQKLLELRLQKQHNPEPESADPTVASIVDLYLSMHEKKLGERTYSERKYYLQLFAEFTGWRTIRASIPFHLTSFLDKNEQWQSDWTKATIVAIVQRPFNWATKQKLIPSNPFAGVSHQPGAPRRPMTDDEFQRLLKAASGSYGKKRRPTPGARFRQIVVALRYTGCRPGELASLKWSNIDPDRGEIVLQRHKTSRMQRDPKPRIIPLHPVIIKMLVYLRRYATGDHVFTTFRGTPWNRSSLSLRVQRARKVAGISDDMKLYGIRHQFGTKAIVNGVDLKTLAELMGHTTTKMTEHYLHLAGERQHLASAMRRAISRHSGS